MKFLRDSDWNEVFAGWEARESSDPGWIECATKIKGWPDWKSWRGFTGQQIGAKDRNWKLFEFTNPIKEIPEMLVGPFSGWQSRHPMTNAFNFKEMLDVEEQLNFWSAHQKINSLMAQFPSPTEFIGLVRMDLGKIVCLEGHHRATAVALSAKSDTPIKFDRNPTIALFELPETESGLMEQMLRRGTGFQK